MQTDVPVRFRDALDARDVQGVLSLLAEDVVFRSPVVFKPYHGHAAVTPILRAVFSALDEWRCVRMIGAPGDRDHALVFEARIGDRQLQGCDFLHLDERGAVDEFYVMVRPLSGALALAEAMGAHL